MQKTICKISKHKKVKRIYLVDGVNICTKCTLNETRHPEKLCIWCQFKLNKIGKYTIYSEKHVYRFASWCDKQVQMYIRSHKVYTDKLRDQTVNILGLTK